MLRRLFGLFAMGLLGWLLSRIVRGAAGARVPRRPPAAGPRVDGRMVRDRVCDTYLPESSAVTARVDGETHYFCGEACRARFLAGGRATRPA